MSRRPKSHFRRLRWDVALWVFVIAVPFLNGGVSYLDGYNGGHFIMLLSLVQLALLLMALVCLLVLLIRFILDLVASRSPWPGAVLLSSAFAGLVLPIILLPSHSVWFLAGFAAGFDRRLAEPDILKVAEIARAYLPNQSVYRSPTKRLSPPNADEAGIESHLRHAPLEKIPGAFTIANRNGVVEIEWGSALVGHWGLRIAPEKVSVDPYDYAFRQIDDRLAAYYTD